MSILQWMFLWWPSVVIRTECRTQAPAWRKAIHTTGGHTTWFRGKYSHLENYVMTWGWTKATMWLQGAGKGNYVMSLGWTEKTEMTSGWTEGPYVITSDWTKDTIRWHGTEQRRLWDDKRLSKENCQDMQPNEATMKLCGGEKGNYVMSLGWAEEPYVITSDWTQDTIRWHGTEQRRLWDNKRLSKENCHNMQPNKATMKLCGGKKGNYVMS